MKSIIRIISIVLALAMIFSCMAFAETTGTLTIAGKTAKTVTVHIDKDSKVKLTLADDKMSHDMKFTDHIEKATAEMGQKASLSVNGTVFNAYYDKKAELYFPGNCARVEQTLVRDGVTVSSGGSGFHSTLGFTKDGRVLIDYAQVQTYLTIGGEDLYPWGVNEYYDGSAAVMYFTEHLGYPVTVPETSVVYIVRDGKIAEKTTGGIFAEPAKGEQLIIVNSGYRFNANVGTAVKVKRKVSVRFGNAADWNDLETAIACDPFLLANGTVQTSINTVYEDKMGNDYVAGRTFAAVDYNNNLTVGIVTASPNQIAEALKAAGYKDAMLLDGGGSSALSSSKTLYSNPSRLLTNVLHIIESEDDPAAMPFSDVKKTDYFYDAVKWAYEKKITTGMSATQFGTALSCTRGQVVTFLYRAAGEPEPKSTENKFTDVKESDYYYKPILWAVEKGITNGVSEDLFAPNSPCTNGHILTFIWRYMGQPNKSQTSEFWYSDAMNWAQSKGMLLGLPTVVPSNACPRANVVYFLYQMSK